MKQEEVKEFRDLVAELKESVLTDNQEAVAKINERMDALELDVKNIPAKVETKDEATENKTRAFRETARSFITGEDRKGLNANEEVKSILYPNHRKSDNFVRFDFATAGALLLPDSVSGDIIRNVVEATPMLQMARVTTTNAPNYKRRTRTGTPGGQWLGEDVADTKGKIAYSTIDITPHKWAARYAVTVEQLDDAAYDLVREMTDAFRDDASVDLGSAFVAGTGVGQPTGMKGNITNFNATQLALSTDDLIRMQESIKDAYKGNASWLFTRTTRGYIRTKVLSSTNGLQYTWEPSFKVGAPTLLLGAPVYIAAVGDLASKASGNFTSGDVYAIYGDFSQGYEIVRRTDMYMIDDPYTEASSFVRNLHIMSRFGGNVIKSEALVQITAAGA